MRASRVSPFRRALDPEIALEAMMVERHERVDRCLAAADNVVRNIDLVARMPAFDE
jgi:hypothetical protein